MTEYHSVHYTVISKNNGRSKDNSNSLLSI